MSKIWSVMIYVSWYTETILLFYYFVLEMSNINKNDGTLSDNMIELIISTKEPDVSKKWSISTYRLCKKGEYHEISVILVISLQIAETMIPMACLIEVLYSTDS